MLSSRVSPCSDVTATATFFGRWLCQSGSVWRTSIVEGGNRPVFSVPASVSLVAWTTMSEIFLNLLLAESWNGIGDVKSSLPLLLFQELSTALFLRTATSGSCWINFTSRTLLKMHLKTIEIKTQTVRCPVLLGWEMHLSGWRVKKRTNTSWPGSNKWLSSCWWLMFKRNYRPCT